MNDAHVLVHIADQFEASVDAARLEEAALATLRACSRTNCAISIQVVDDAVVAVQADLGAGGFERGCVGFALVA